MYLLGPMVDPYGVNEAIPKKFLKKSLKKSVLNLHAPPPPQKKKKKTKKIFQKSRMKMGLLKSLNFGGQNLVQHLSKVRQARPVKAPVLLR